MILRKKWRGRQEKLGEPSDQYASLMPNEVEREGRKKKCEWKHLKLLSISEENLEDI